MAFARSSKTTLEHTKSHAFDLILLDLMMPEMDGFEVCERLKSDTGTGIAEEHITKLFRIDAKYKHLGTARQKGPGLAMRSKKVTHFLPSPCRRGAGGEVKNVKLINFHSFGLLLCQEFVKQHGGSIRVVREVGKGSTFSFTLPKELIEA